MSRIEKGHVWLTVAEAVAMLPDGDRIHTYKVGSGIPIGASWDRADLLLAISEAPLEEAGQNMTERGHGLVVWTDPDSPLFVETKRK